LLLQFFIKKLLLVLIDRPGNSFEFSWIFMELYIFIIDSPVQTKLVKKNIPGAKNTGESKLTVYWPLWSLDSPLYLPLRSHDLPVYSPLRSPSLYPFAIPSSISMYLPLFFLYPSPYPALSLTLFLLYPLLYPALHISPSIPSSIPPWIHPSITNNDQAVVKRSLSRKGPWFQLIFLNCTYICYKMW
jgi:hypothetical protein